MTKDDIMRMGREAGMHDPMIFILAYERFANLVAAFAADREREECAKLCESVDEKSNFYRYDYRRGVLDAAAAIRERGNT